MGGATLCRTSVSARKSHCTFFFTRGVSTVTYFSIWICQWGVRCRMAGLYNNLAIKVQLILKMQLICSLLKNLSFKIVRRLASLLPRKTRTPELHNNTLFFCGNKIRKENSLNNLTTIVLSFSSPPARKVTRERKRAPRVGHLPRGWRFSII